MFFGGRGRKTINDAMKTNGFDSFVSFYLKIAPRWKKNSTTDGCYYYKLIVIQLNRKVQNNQQETDDEQRWIVWTRFAILISELYFDWKTKLNVSKDYLFW